MTPRPALPISIVLVTYRRESVLLDTVRSLLVADARALEILVIDQTETHVTPPPRPSRNGTTGARFAGSACSNRRLRMR